MHRAGPSRVTIPSRQYELESESGFPLTPVSTGSKDGLRRRGVGMQEEEIESEEMVYEVESDPFVPFPDEPGIADEKDGDILTVRAVVVGCMLGALVNASNIYLGLKTGWIFSANLFGAIFGFAILKACAVGLPAEFPILGGSFGPKENSIVQTTATAAGGLGGIFVSAIPALYQLDLLKDPVQDFPRLLTFTMVSAYYGLLFATPLRKFFIIHVARELNLVFPTATATAMTIRSMHSLTGTSGKEVNKRTKALVIAFTLAVCFRVGSSYAPGILWDWHIFSWMFVWSGYSNYAIHINNWGWIYELTPAFVGSGMLVGLNPAVSFLSGSILAWGIIGPILVHKGIAHGVGIIPPGAPGYDKWKDLVSFNSFMLEDPKNAPSPRYWLLWPGVLIMICSSFTELAVQYKLIWYGAKCAWRATCRALNDLGNRMGRDSLFLRQQSYMRVDNPVNDPAPDDQQVRLWQWGPPLIVVIVSTCVVLALQYHLSVEMSILAILLGFFFAFLAIQCTGATDTTPLTTAAKASQMLLGAASTGEGHTKVNAQRLNLIGGAIASGAASQSTDLVVDFRVGFLLKTPPRLQWYAQAIGSVVAMFMSPAMFILFTKAYPCVLDAKAESCAFAAPSVATWRAVSIAVTDPTLPLPLSSGVFAICSAVLVITAILVRHNVLVGKFEIYLAYFPSFMAVGLGFVLPQTQYSLAMMTGATISYFWAKKRPLNYDTFCYAVAAGMIAGEGLGGVLNALLEIIGAGSSKYGSAVGCPGDQFCG